MTPTEDHLRSVLRSLGPGPEPTEATWASITRRAHHRRRRLIAGIGLAVAAGGTGLGFGLAEALAPAGHPSQQLKLVPGPGPSSGLSSVSVSLPPADSFDRISTTAGGDIVLGGTLSVTANTASPTCVQARVDPATARVSKPRPVACDDPSLDGRTVGLRTQNLPGGPSGTLGNVMITTVSASGHISAGPVVTTYSDCSDCRPVTAYGAGKLWIYDNSTTKGAEVLEVSDTTGRVLATVAMPKLFRPLLAANDTGVFIANSIEGGQAPGEPPPSALYHVAPGATAPATVVADSSLLACWLTAAGNHLWVGMGAQAQGCARQTIWRLDGTDPRAAFQVPASAYLPPAVVGDDAHGLWTVEWRTPNTPAGLQAHVTPELLYIDPQTGKEMVSGTLPPTTTNAYGPQGLSLGSAVLVGRDLYFLGPPSRGTGYASLTRVTVSRR